MATKDFKTRSIFMERQNSFPKNIWNIGIDIGYSAVKVMSPNAVCCFPSYAVMEESDSFSIDPLENSEVVGRNIRYKDEDGHIWSVGEAAQDSISVYDTSAASDSIYSRNRYDSPMYLVLFRVGLAMGLRRNSFGSPDGKKLRITTGLPPKYMTMDKGMLLPAITGRHRFFVMLHKGIWEPYDFLIKEEDISIIDQPEGTLYSIMTSSKLRRMPDAAKYMSSRLLIMDPGFGTLDCFSVIRGKVSRGECQTYPDLGMRRVFEETAKEVLDRFGFEIPVPAMQSYLAKGTVLSMKGERKRQPFGEILDACNRNVCREAVDKLKRDYRLTMDNYDYLVLTGGTGDAWKAEILSDPELGDPEVITILAGNQGDPSLPMLFSNVRGYFIHSLITAGRK